jgi:hypothetical protein
MSLAKFLAIFSILAAPAFAGESKLLRWQPESKLFYCDIPQGWIPFEEEDPSGTAVHILGPDSPSGTYRAGIDVRWIERGMPGYVPAKKFVEDMRRSDKPVSRNSTTIRPMRISGALARTFEVVETRRLPPEGLPAVEEELHKYVAVIPRGENYYLVTLASTREVYLQHRQLFIDFLHSFKASGYR